MIQANVWLQIENLRRPDFEREAEEAGLLQSHGWLQEIGKADVHILTTRPGIEIKRVA